ncbi:MAG TPA: DUF1638 domain-containing protein [Methylomusa anaerophila]|uniref:DUF1638 domain-containing protein n=1 Tax=Methylomusa anaerophila TaxID=1930071 RepID=A0A348AL59_9FIRM|nr:DUF1638 domain-containing protein [Methylomusa anaerophila]BBB91807.1 hypothetical protein MAMMFC1_02492 [Methylomusa anaerophila]HML88459.1 DUF1638 domain-containing protein [Methylomusa anaerophila]
MRIKLIGCPSTRNEVMAMELPSNVDCEFLDFSLHAFPDELHNELQRRIDASQAYDLIILLYGRCSRAVAGLVSAGIPMVLPAVHDCISLLLGSDLRRQQLSARNPAVYYFSQGWLEYGRDPYAEYCEYVDKYGTADAGYLIRTLYGTYRGAVLIRTCGGGKIEECRQKVKNIADFFDWSVTEVEGDLGLLTAVVGGKQHPDIIWVPPGKPVKLEEGNSSEYQSQF